MPNQNKVAVGCKILREELPAMKSVARKLGFKNMSQWLETILRREYTKSISEILGQESKENQNVPAAPPAA